jgi:hypothetical protein
MTIGVYVDDWRSPQRTLKPSSTHGQNMSSSSGSGTLTYHLGCEFYRDDEGVLNKVPGNTLTRWWTTILGCSRSSEEVLITIGER